jgi:mutator protein MutT
MKKPNYPIKELTLGYLVNDDQVLLAMKKRGFGEGKYNGVGGKLKADETKEEALIRETEEEIGVTPKKFEEIALLDFYYPGKGEGGEISRVYVYLITEWEGEITESEEMKPRWFNKSSLPFEKMWAPDKVWFLKALDGETLAGDFYFDQDYNFLDFEFKPF